MNRLRLDLSGMDTIQRQLAITAMWVVGLVAGYELLDHILPHGLPLNVLFEGVVLGGLTSFTAMGLVLIYRAVRIFNFAQSAMGGLAAAIAVIIVTGQHWNYWIGISLGMAAAVLTGVLIHLLVQWRFTRAPRLILTVATIGIGWLIGAAQVALPTLFANISPTSAFTTPFNYKFKVSGQLFNANYIVAIVVVPVVLLGLYLFFQRTDTGTAIRAAADSEERALLLGIPVKRLSLITWVVAAALSGVGAILSTPITGINLGVATGPTDLLIPLGAAVLAGMDSLPMAVVWSIALEVLNQAVFNSYNQSTYTEVAVFFFILAALMLKRQERRRVSDGGLGGYVALREIRPIPDVLSRLKEVRAGRNVGYLIVAAVLLVVVPLTVNVVWLSYLTSVAVFGLLGVSLVVISGYAGQLNLCNYALAGIGAAVAGSLMVHLHAELLLAMLGAAAAGAVVAVAIGIPSLRISGLYLAVTTLAFAVMAGDWLLSATYFPWLNPANVQSPLLFDRFNLQSQRWLFELAALVLVAGIFIAGNFRRSRAGRSVIGMRDNSRAAASYGISPFRSKLMAFAIAGALAGVAGSVLVLQLGGLGYAGVNADTSVYLFAWVVIGGMGSITGGLLGAVFYELVLHLTTGSVQLLVQGVGLLVVLMIVPEGLGWVYFLVRDKILESFVRRRGIGVEPSGAAEAPAALRSRPADGTGMLLAPAEQAGSAAGASRGLARSAAMRLAALEDLEIGAAGGVPGATGDPAGLARSESKPATVAKPLVETADIDFSFGSSQVLFGVSIGVSQGEIIALLGTNGAGKSTTLRTIAGLLPPRSGHVNYVGQNVNGEAVVDRVKNGLVTVLGGRGIFPSLTVEENLVMGAWIAKHHYRNHEFVEAAMERVLQLFPQLANRLTQRAEMLSGGEQQMLALSQALLCKPKLLMIDELSLGLAPTVVADLLKVVSNLGKSGVTVIVVEQSVNVATAVANRAVFMERGKVRFSGPTPELSQQPRLLRAVFTQAAKRARVKSTGVSGSAHVSISGGVLPAPLPGVPAAQSGLAQPGDSLSLQAGSGIPGVADVASLIAGAPPAKAAVQAGAQTAGQVSEDPGSPGAGPAGPAGPAIPGLNAGDGGASLYGGQAVMPGFQVAGISVQYGGVSALHEVSIEVANGEIVGIIGTNGAGKTTLFDVCSGFLRPSQGRVIMHGEDITEMNASQRASRGLGRVFQDARLFPNVTVFEAIEVACEQHVSVRDPLACILGVAASKESEEEVRVKSERLIYEMGLERYRNNFVNELSTGTRRILEFTCLMAHEPSVLLLDEPTSGIAQRESEALGELVLGVKEETGAAILVIEHDVPLVASISDRLVCMHLGEVIAEGDTASVLENAEVIASYLGTEDDQGPGRPHDGNMVGVSGANPAGSLL